MKLKRRWLLVIAVLLLAALLTGAGLRTGAHGTRVRIVQDGEVLCALDLAAAEDQFIETDYAGRRNVIEIQNGKIRMLHADCPDQICVRMGWLDGPAPIVCLPNRLTIEWAQADGDIDAVAQ